jgi:hypothetical protein
MCYFHTNNIRNRKYPLLLFILLVTVNSDTIKERLLFSIPLQTTGPVVKLLTELKSPYRIHFLGPNSRNRCFLLTPYDYTRLLTSAVSIITEIYISSNFNIKRFSNAISTFRPGIQWISRLFITFVYWTFNREGKISPLTLIQQFASCVRKRR